MTGETQDWQELCAAILKEHNRVKVLELMEKLLAVLDERRISVSGAHEKRPNAN
jgi:hypothetical protein